MHLLSDMTKHDPAPTHHVPEGPGVTVRLHVFHVPEGPGVTVRLRVFHVPEGPGVTVRLRVFAEVSARAKRFAAQSAAEGFLPRVDQAVDPQVGEPPVCRETQFTVPLVKEVSFRNTEANVLPRTVLLNVLCLNEVGRVEKTWCCSSTTLQSQSLSYVTSLVRKIASRNTEPNVHKRTREKTWCCSKYCLLSKKIVMS